MSLAWGSRGTSREVLVVWQNLLVSTRRLRIAIDRHQRVLRLAARQFLTHTIAQLRERFPDLRANHAPLWLDAVSLEFGSHSFRDFPDPCRFRAEVWIVEHLFHRSQLVRP